MSRQAVPALSVATVMVIAVLAGCTRGASGSLSAAGGSASRPAAAAVGPPCSASLLFEAAVAGQHFSTNAAEYPPQPGQGPGAYGPVCDGAWAIAVISHPQVGTTDGVVLFHVKAGSWRYVEGVGGMPADCLLEQAGVPSSIAKVLWPPSQSQPSSYCSQ